MGNAKRTLEHNAEMVDKFLRASEGKWRGTAGSSFNLEEMSGKPEATSPMSSYGERFVWENWAASTILNTLLNQLRRERFDLYFAVLKLENDPGAWRRWQEPETEDDEDDARAYALACRKVAEWLYEWMPGYMLSVTADPQDEPADSPIQAHNRRLAQKKRWTARDGYKRLYGRFERFEEEHPDMSREAAKELFIQREEREAAKKHREAVSLRTLERAINHIEKGEVA